MKQKYSESFQQNIGILVSNTIRLICFTVLAVIFNHWWIVLFVIPFWTSQGDKGD